MSIIDNCGAIMAVPNNQGGNLLSLSRGSCVDLTFDWSQCDGTQNLQWNGNSYWGYYEIYQVTTTDNSIDLQSEAVYSMIWFGPGTVIT